MKEHNDEKVAVIPFLKCFSGLVGAFPPEEVIFMMYMADRTRLREKGYDTLRSKPISYGEYGDRFASF